jgi:hypothetical protein
MPFITARKTILEALKARCEGISVAAGFNTDMGRQVFLGDTVVLGENDLPAAIAIVPADDGLRWQGLKGMGPWPIEIQAVAAMDFREPWLVVDGVVIEDAWLVIEAILQDVKRAVEVLEGGKKMIAGYQIERGTNRTIEREPGSSLVGAAVTYYVTYAETWGAP